MAILTERKLEATPDFIPTTTPVITPAIMPAITPEATPPVPPVPVTVYRTQEWMSNPWMIDSATADSEMAQWDTLRLRTNGTIAIQRSSLGDTETWATWGTDCQLTCQGLAGLTMDNVPFLILFDVATGKMTCTLPDPGPGAGSGPGSSLNQGLRVQGTDGHFTVNGPIAIWVAEEGGPGNRDLPGLKPTLPVPVPAQD